MTDGRGGRIGIPRVEIADCLAGDAVGDPVFITGPKVGSRWQVAACDNLDLAKMPAIGVIRSKISSTICEVQVGGELAVFSGLASGKTVFVGAPGVQQAPIVRPVAGTKVLQKIGTAVSASTIQVDVDQDELVIRP